METFASIKSEIKRKNIKLKLNKNTSWFINTSIDEHLNALYEQLGKDGLNKNTGKTLDFSKLHPVVWDEFSCDYFAVGENLGHWFKLGREYNKENLKYKDQLNSSN